MSAFPNAHPLAVSRLIRATAFALTGLCAVASAQAADLTVRVTKLLDDSGTVFVALFDNESDFPQKVRYGIQMPAARRSPDGTLRVVFADLPPGRYALSVFHDRDGNGKLSTNLMGLPVEPYGFSNEAKASFGPPQFQAAAIELGAQGSTVEVAVQ